MKGENGGRNEEDAFRSRRCRRPVPGRRVRRRDKPATDQAKTTTDRHRPPRPATTATTASTASDGDLQEEEEVQEDLEEVDRPGDGFRGSGHGRARRRSKPSSKQLRASTPGPRARAFFLFGPGQSSRQRLWSQSHCSGWRRIISSRIALNRAVSGSASRSAGREAPHVQDGLDDQAVARRRDPDRGGRQDERLGAVDDPGEGRGRRRRPARRTAPGSRRAGPRAGPRGRRATPPLRSARSMPRAASRFSMIAFPLVVRNAREPARRGAGCRAGGRRPTP